MIQTGYSLYFHIPFCVHRCAYCDFNTYAGQGDVIPDYVKALGVETRCVGEANPNLEVGTVFFGGGTPSLLTADQFEKIFSSLQTHYHLLPGAEISLEANPGTVTPASLKDLRAVGFNRISFGVQSANPGELRMLERIHTYKDVISALTWARQARFDNVNVDLIYGLPEQRLETWQHTVRLMADLNPEHVSAYALTLEHGTPFGRWASKGLLPLPDPDVAAEQYEWTMDYLGGRGYEQYEISNWGMPGMECRHNLQYWRNYDYLGLGAGAHGYADGIRYSNVLRIKTYIDRCEKVVGSWKGFPLSPAAVNQHRNSRLEDMQETMMTGLRLTKEGVSSEVFMARFGTRLVDAFGREVDDLIKLGLLEWDDKNLRLTMRGRLLGNQVFMRFV